MSAQLVIPRRLVSNRHKLSSRFRSWRYRNQNGGLREHPGRPVGKPHGSWVGELTDLRKAVVLCWACGPKFGHQRSHYYRVDRYPSVQGKCDGCRQWSLQAKLYVHESFLTEPGGRAMSGQVVSPI